MLSRNKIIILDFIGTVLIIFVLFILYESLQNYNFSKSKHEQYPSVSYYSGSDLVFLSEIGKDTDLAKVDGYIIGVSDASTNAIWCAPTPIDYKLLNKLVSKYVYANPKRWHMPAKLLIYETLFEQYPCD